jgi:hypothetical protein
MIPSDTLWGTISFFGVVLYIGWIYAVGCSMNKSIPQRLRPQKSYFKFSCLFILVALFGVMLTGGYNINQDNIQDYGYKAWVLIPFSFYLIWSMLYIFAFAARMLESVIEGQVVGFSDALKAFFGFWFFPIGLWYIQPAVQRILQSQSEIKT